MLEREKASVYGILCTTICTASLKHTKPEYPARSDILYIRMPKHRRGYNFITIQVDPFSMLAAGVVWRSSFFIPGRNYSKIGIVVIYTYGMVVGFPRQFCQFFNRFLCCFLHCHGECLVFGIVWLLISLPWITHGKCYWTLMKRFSWKSGRLHR